MNPANLGRLIDENAAALELYAAQWTSLSTDVVQEAFVELIRARTVPDRVVPWLYRVVRNRAINAGRSESRRRRHEQQAAIRREWFDPESHSHLEADEAAEYLNQIPIEQREVIVARIWGQLSFEQISELADTSVSTAHRRYQAGIEALRERFCLPWLTNEAS